VFDGSRFQALALPTAPVTHAAWPQPHAISASGAVSQWGLQYFSSAAAGQSQLRFAHILSSLSSISFAISLISFKFDFAAPARGPE
jgi:hypothetical protein